MIAALYIDPRGPYVGRADVDAWDEARDAKRYAGPWPVVAHPPCGPWGRLKFQCTRQDPECALRAVAQVRAFGGVLEHPEHSDLWEVPGLGMLWPGAGRDAWGGYTIAVRQVEFGHVCAKPTWVYCVGVPVWLVQSYRVPYPGAQATHKVTNGPRGKVDLPRAGNLRNRLTPPEFARFLLTLAASTRW